MYNLFSVNVKSNLHLKNYWLQKINNDENKCVLNYSLEKVSINWFFKFSLPFHFNFSDLEVY